MKGMVTVDAVQVECGRSPNPNHKVHVEVRPRLEDGRIGVGQGQVGDTVI